MKFSYNIIMPKQIKSKITPQNICRLLKKYPIQCFKCGVKVGTQRLDGKCRNCKYPNEESLVQWVFEREDIDA